MSLGLWNGRQARAGEVLVFLGLGCTGCGGSGSDAAPSAATMTPAGMTGDSAAVPMSVDPGAASGTMTSAGSVNPPATDGGGLGAAPVAGPLTYSACGPGHRVGAFSVALIPEMLGAAPNTQITGRVRDAGDPREVWDELMVDGDCRLTVGASHVCDPRCASGENCVGDNLCMAPPNTVDVGLVTIEGLGVEAAIKPNPGTGQYYFAPPAGMMLAYPPFAEGAPLSLQAEGGEYGAFQLRSQGIAPLVVATDTFMIAENTPLSLEWEPPTTELPSRVQALVDIAHHGGVSARIECDLPDTGAATISAALVTALMDRGVAGFPIVALARRVVDSVQTSLGCVEFSVVSTVERPATIPGLTSCNTDDECPTGQACAQGRLCSE